MIDMIDNSKPIALACRLDKENALKLTGDIVDYLLENNKKIVLESRIASRFQRFISKMDLRQMTMDRVEMIISVGGDGTMLRVAQNLPHKRSAPILGINLGSVGFLDECNSDNKSLYAALDKIIKGDYKVERCMRLSTYYKKKRLNDALNEVLVISSKPSKVLHVGIKVDNITYNRGYVDGVIISTSVGSTAYCLSAGGALIDPRLRVIQIVPINSFAGAGGLKPLVLPASSEVEIQLIRPKLNGLIIIDGQQEIMAPPGSIIKVRKSENDVRFVRLNKSFQKGFYNKLRSKILRGIRIPQGDSPEE